MDIELPLFVNGPFRASRNHWYENVWTGHSETVQNLLSRTVARAEQESPSLNS
jgi:hypothetical protein